MPREEDWIEDEEVEDDYYPIEYNITSSPNDFNVKTLFDFMESGTVKIPSFQRNYVWDRKRASRLVESIIMGLPIPQLFLYERGKNEFLVIDGQQRLMTLYYFMKGRFPRKEKRAELRRYIDMKGNIPEYVLEDDSYFSDFTLDLAAPYADNTNRLHKRSLESLNDEDRSSFVLSPIRCIFIKQHAPSDDTSMYEIFFRLNTGGVNLTPQEIRSSLYHSEFYSMLARINLDARWRRLTTAEPDIRMRDIEILLRGFAILMHGDDYKDAMLRFLNRFSLEAKSFDKDRVLYLESLFKTFLEKAEDLPPEAFQLQSGRVSASIFEAVFTAVAEDALRNKSLAMKKIDPKKLLALKKDDEFQAATRYKTTGRENLLLRIKKARDILG